MPAELDGGSEGGMFQVKGDGENSIFLEPTVNGKPVKMELDTGTAVSLVSEKVWNNLWPESELKKCNILLKTYTDERLHVLGQLQVKVEFNGQVAQLPLLVVKGDGPTLWGRTWLRAIRLNWKHIKQVKQVTQGLDSLLQKYSVVF